MITFTPRQLEIIEAILKRGNTVEIKRVPSTGQLLIIESTHVVKQKIPIE